MGSLLNVLACVGSFNPIFEVGTLISHTFKVRKQVQRSYISLLQAHRGSWDLSLGQSGPKALLLTTDSAYHQTVQTGCSWEPRLLKWPVVFRKMPMIPWLYQLVPSLG